MQTQSLGTHQSTYDAVFQHPIARNLAWRDVCSMLSAMSDVSQEEHNGDLKLSRNGKTLMLHRPLHKDMQDVQELMNLRRFLEQSQTVAPPQSVAGAHLLVVIDHRLARIYKTELHGSVPQQIVPYDASGSGRHLHHVEADASGQRKPEVRSFYQAVARTMERAEKILIFGSGTGASSAMEQLLAELDHHDRGMRRRVIAAIVVDNHHLTEDQLLAKAREVYAGLDMETL